MLNTIFTLDNTIIIIYLLITLLVGLYYGVGNKSIRDYAIGNRNFSNLTLFSTIIATSLGGTSIIFVTSEVYKYGIAATFVFCGATLSTIFRAYVMSTKFERYHKKNLISAGEMMSLDYGKAGQILTGLCSFFMCSGYMAIQLKVIGEIFGYCLGVDTNLSIFTSSIIIIIYATFGGIRSVAFTDVLQFATLMITIPLMANIGLNYIGGFSGLIDSIPPTKLDVVNLPTEIKSKYLSLFLLFTPILTTPVDYQRLLMAKDTLQAKESYKNAAFTMFGYLVFVAIIAFTALVLNPNIAPNKVFVYMIDQYMSPGLKGVALVGVIAMVMSTADSFINNSGVALVNDVLKPLNIVKSTEENELLYTKLATFLISMIGLYAALKNDDLITMLLKMSVFWSPVIAPAIFMNIFGFKTSVRNLFIAAAIGVLVTSKWELYNLSKIFIINNIIGGTIVNIISLILLDKLFNSSKNLAVKN